MDFSELDQNDPAHSFAFISYAHESGSVALDVAVQLKQMGVRVWIDRDAMHSDTHTRIASERIWTALGEATDLIAIACKHSMSKPWVLHEWQTAAARWMATGSPRIHLLMIDSDLELPTIPFHSISRGIDNLPGTLTEFIGKRALEATIPKNENDWTATIRRLRSQYLMGGATAVRAVHEFDTIWPAFREKINHHTEHGWGNFEFPAKYLVWLGQILDLRVSRKWLWSVLESAICAPLPLYDLSILKNNLGISLLYGGKMELAQFWFESSAQDCKSENDNIGAAIAEGNLALLNLEIGNLPRMNYHIGEARESLSEAQSIPHNQSELIAVEALLINHEGRAHLCEGEYRESKEYFTKQIAYAEIIESRRLIGVGLGFFSLAEIHSGKFGPSTILALDRYREISISSLNPSGVANASGWRALMEFASGNAAAALHFIDGEIALRAGREEFFESRRAYAWKAIFLGFSGEAIPDTVRDQILSNKENISKYDIKLFEIALGRLNRPEPNCPTEEFITTLIDLFRANSS